MSGPLDRDSFNEKVVYKRANDFCTCWWPTWAQRESLDNPFSIIASNRATQITEWAPVERGFAIESGDTTDLDVATFYYPRWKATVNGEPVEVGIGTNGTIKIAIPSEKSNVRLYFEEPLIIVSAMYVSALSWIGIAFSLVALGVRSFGRNYLVFLGNRNKQASGFS